MSAAKGPCGIQPRSNHSGLNTPAPDLALPSIHVQEQETIVLHPVRAPR